MTSDLMLDVEESLRQEKLDIFWKEYGTTIILAVVLTILFTAGASIKRSYDKSVNEKATVTILDAIRSDESADVLQAAEVDRSTHKIVALLVSSAQYLKDGRLSEAHKGYKLLAEDTSIPPLYRDLALLQTVRTSFAMQGDDFDARSSIRTLNTIIGSPGNPWRYHAAIQKALIQVDSDGDYEAARKTLDVVTKANDVPVTLIRRATALDHVYGIQAEKRAVEQGETKAEDETNKGK
jgi:hypothetical protein